MGKVIVVDFWASWCGPCKEAMPALEKVHRKYRKKGLIVVGVNVDSEKRLGQEFLKSNPVSFKVAYDKERKLASILPVRTMPSSYVLDRTGKVRYIHEGFHSGTPGHLENQVRKLLAKSKKR